MIDLAHTGITSFSAWAPELGSAAENLSRWQDWAYGRLTIPQSNAYPELPFVPSLFKRRLSQISRMTIQVVHDILPAAPDTKIVFASYRGELARQLSINKMILEENDVRAAAFSLSVFNAPPALATIVLGITAGYTAVFPADDAFSSAFEAAAAPVAAQAEKRMIFVYADEYIPDEYRTLHSEVMPLAFAAVLSCTGETGNGSGKAEQLSAQNGSANPVVPAAALFQSGSPGLRTMQPQDFLKQLILCGTASGTN